MVQLELEVLFHIDNCFFLAFVIGDGISSDQLCGQYKNYSPNVARISQTCDVPFQECDNPNWKCTFLKMEQLQSILIQGLELSGLILDENVTQMPTNQRQYQLNDCMSKLSLSSCLLADIA